MTSAREIGQEVGALLLVAQWRDAHIRASDKTCRVSNVTVERRGIPDEASSTLSPHGIRILEARNSSGRPTHDSVQTRALQVSLLIGIDGVTRVALLKNSLAAHGVAHLGTRSDRRQ